MSKKILLLVLLALCSSMAYADAIRYALPNNNPFPIARAVEVGPETTLIFHSGQIPSPANPDTKKGSREYYGNTEVQTVNVFKGLQKSLAELGLSFADVIKLNVYLVGDPTLDNTMDFAGFMQGYTQFFATKEQPNKPARSVVQVAGLVGGPNMLVEIDMVIARADK